MSQDTIEGSESQPGLEAHEAQEPTLDPAMVEHVKERLREEQSLTGGVLAGLVAALAGAALWAVITVVTDYQIGWMAVGIGFLVGFAVRAAGKGLDQGFGIAGALLALFGCLMGNLLTVVYFVADAEKLGYFATLTSIRPAAIPELMAITFSPIDLLFYGIAIYEGYKLSFRQITQEDLERATGAGRFAP